MACLAFFSSAPPEVSKNDFLKIKFLKIISSYYFIL